MLESTREFLRELDEKAHHTRLPDEYMQKAVGLGITYEQWQKEHQAKQAQEQARIERYKRGEYTEQERKASEEAMREMLAPIEEQIKKERAKEVSFYEKLNNHKSNQEGREQVERLLEIARDKDAYLNTMIREAEAQGNDILIEQYTQEKADNDKNIELYRGKYEEYKAAAEG